ncbi:DNA repair protein RecN, partial [Verminephrobacter sp. Larva24]
HRHLVVTKQKGAAGTSSTVLAVQGEQRIAEMARMLGGERATETTLAHAREMLGAAGTTRQTRQTSPGQD